MYLGQFIDHDIRCDSLSLFYEVGPNVEHTLSHCILCLDLYCCTGETDRRWRVSTKVTGCISGWDGPKRLATRNRVTTMDRDKENGGYGNRANLRNDENLVIAELHVLFAKFHNRILDLLKRNSRICIGPTGTNLFTQARRFVTWHYQWVVMNDFLPHVVQVETLKDIQKRGLHPSVAPTHPGMLRFLFRSNSQWQHSDSATAWCETSIC